MFFTPTHCVGFRATFDMVAKKSSLSLNSHLRRPARRRHYTEWAIPGPHSLVYMNQNVVSRTITKINQTKVKLRDFRLLPWCKWGLRSSGMLRSVRVVASHRRFGTTYRFHLQGSSSPRSMISFMTAWPLKMGKIGCPETLVTSY
jgi:hypothetical protein